MQGDEKDYFARMARQVAEQRDQAAFGVLFDYYAPRLNAWLRSQGLTIDEAEELVQEVMTVLWNRASLYDPAKSSLSTWLFRIARNRRLDAQRRTRGKDTYHDIDWLKLDLDLAHSVADEEDRDAQVREALKQIPGEQMELVQAAFFLGQTHTEIARSTGLPLGTVKSRMRLAFQRLRRMLHDRAGGG